MSVFSTITTDILIEPCQLDCLNEYVLEKLKFELQNRIFSNEYGYITQIVGIEEIKFKCLSFSNHDGCMVYTVKFNAICENPKPGDYIHCPILQCDDIMFSFVGPMEIIVRAYNEFIDGRRNKNSNDNNDSNNNNSNNDNSNNSNSNNDNNNTYINPAHEKSAVVKVEQTQLDVSRNIIKVLAVLMSGGGTNNINDNNNNSINKNESIQN